MSEPVVDTVERSQIATTHCPVKVVDLYTVQIEDLTFEQDFQLTVKRDDYIHAFVTFFNVEFTKSHRPISFSTSPEARYTHWKQTVFYIEDFLTVSQGEQIGGKFAMRPSINNRVSFLPVKDYLLEM